MADSNNKTKVVKDLPNKKIIVTREFDAPLEHVWKAWTESELLDQWWAPKPYKVITNKMSFKVGGFWHYRMVGPEGDTHWCRADYEAINNLKSFQATDSFCDEKGVKNPEFPSATWFNEFHASANGTTVVVNIRYATEDAIKKILEMGFEQGFTMALGNLDQYLEAQFKIRNELKTEPKARTSSYLNFPGNAEEALSFYKEVFRTEFGGQGIQRFGDLPAEAGQPPIADNVKKMVLHAELTILGGHVLMATDAPKEMGFTVTSGNNMHISLEPSSRQETKRLYDALSKGGTISMELQDMFWGAYSGSCTDRYGINWMFNCIAKG